MDAGAFESRYKFAKPDLDQDNVVLYCRAGVRSEEAAHHFVQAGYTGTRNYRGSWNEWSHDN